MKKNKKILLAVSIISVIGMISAHVLSIREKREEFVEAGVCRQRWLFSLQRLSVC